MPRLETIGSACEVSLWTLPRAQHGQRLHQDLRLVTTKKPEARIQTTHGEPTLSLWHDEVAENMMCRKPRQYWWNAALLLITLLMTLNAAAGDSDCRNRHCCNGSRSATAFEIVRAKEFLLVDAEGRSMGGMRTAGGESELPKGCNSDF